MAKRDYYEVLGLTKSATADEIKKAHRKLVRQYHPDVNKDNKGAEEKFKEVQEAYDVLSDETKRGNYDQFGHAGVGGGVGGGGDPFEAFRRQQGRGGAGGNGKSWRGGPNVTVEEMDPNDFGAGGFGDIFEQLFGRGAAGAAAAGRAGAGPRQRTRTAPQPQQQRGADVNHPVTLAFEQAARGTTLPLQINRDGRLETIDVKIPAGVRDGSRVRIKGKGQQAAAGESGDLFIITHVKPHAHFRREDLDVLLELPISLYEAMLGTKVSVPTLDGPVTLTIPAGTSSHAKLRIKGRGVFRGEEKGDQHVITRVIVPKDLTDEDKELLAKLQSRHPIEARTDVQW